MTLDLMARAYMNDMFEKSAQTNRATLFLMTHIARLFHSVL